MFGRSSRRTRGDGAVVVELSDMLGASIAQLVEPRRDLPVRAGLEQLVDRADHLGKRLADQGDRPRLVDGEGR